MGRLSHIVFMTLMFAPGCKSTPEPTGNVDAGTTSPPPPASQVPPVDPATKKVVTQKDCDTWGEHAGTVLVSSVLYATSSCPPDAREAIRQKFEGSVVSIRGAATSTCSRHVGETYLAGDAACVMKATDALTLRACKFGPLTDPTDSDVGIMLATMHDRCGIPGTMGIPAAPTGSPPAPPAAPQVKGTPI
jgi:hypothetical protein